METGDQGQESLSLTAAEDGDGERLVSLFEVGIVCHCCAAINGTLWTLNSFGRTGIQVVVGRERRWDMAVWWDGREKLARLTHRFGQGWQWCLRSGGEGS